MEHWEALAPGGYRFVYDDALFRPGTDTFLLSSLPRLKPGLRVCDLGCGTGLLGLLLLQRQPALSVTGVDILPEAIALAEQAAVENGLTDRLTFRQGDLRQARDLFPPGSFDLVVCNPPYYPPTSGKLSADSALRAARSEVSCTLEDVCQAAAHLLRWGGSFCLVHKPERLADLCCALRAAGLEPKRLREVCKQAGSAPSLLLMEGRRGGKPGLTIQASLVLQTADGAPTAELNAIYFRSTEDTP
jgi:tRNA1(Val) A37 N6-methylase TrmN6